MIGITTILGILGIVALLAGIVGIGIIVSPEAATVAALSIAVVLAVYFREGIISKLEKKKRSLKSGQISTTKRDSLIEIIFSKELYLFVLIYGLPAYLFITRFDEMGGTDWKVLVAGLLLSTVTIPLAYVLAKKYVDVEKRVAVGLDAAENNLDIWLTHPETIRNIERETDERIGERKNRKGEIRNLVRDIEDIHKPKINGLGPAQVPDDDFLVSDPKRAIRGMREQFEEPFRQIKRIMAQRPGAQANAELATVRELVADYEQAGSQYGKNQEESFSAIDGYEKIDSEERLPEKSGDTADKIIRELLYSESESEGGNNEQE